MTFWTFATWQTCETYSRALRRTMMGMSQNLGRMTGMRMMNWKSVAASSSVWMPFGPAHRKEKNDDAWNPWQARVIGN